MYFRYEKHIHHVNKLSSVCFTCTMFYMYNKHIQHVNKLCSLCFTYTMYYHCTDRIHHVNKLSSVCFTWPISILTTKTTEHTLSSECVKFKVSIFNMYKQAVLSVFYMYNILRYENQLFNVFSLQWSYLTWYEMLIKIINQHKLFYVFSLHRSYSPCQHAEFSVFTWTNSIFTK